MRLIRPLNSINWRYAIGEIFLIAVGVLIALAASDWQSDRTARNSEIAILTQIAEALAQDRDQLVRWCALLESKETKLKELQIHLQARQPYTESLDTLFGSVYGFAGMNINPAAYESLKSQGMDLISDSSLRNQVSLVYEKLYRQIEFNGWLSRSTTLELLRPYYLQNFRDIRFHQNATPLDYERILSDVQFRNLLDYRLQQIQGPHFSMCAFATEKMEMLLKAIADHIK